MPSFNLVNIIAGIHDICYFLMNFCYYEYLSTVNLVKLPFIIDFMQLRLLIHCKLSVFIVVGPFHNFVVLTSLRLIIKFGINKVSSFSASVRINRHHSAVLARGMKSGMTIEYLKCRANLNFEVDLTANSAIGTIVILFGQWIVFINNIIFFNIVTLLN